MFVNVVGEATSTKGLLRGRPFVFRDGFRVVRAPFGRRRDDRATGRERMS